MFYWHTHWTCCRPFINFTLPGQASRQVLFPPLWPVAIYLGFAIYVHIDLFFSYYMVGAISTLVACGNIFRICYICLYKIIYYFSYSMVGAISTLVACGNIFRICCICLYKIIYYFSYSMVGAISTLVACGNIFRICCICLYKIIYYFTVILCIC